MHNELINQILALTPSDRLQVIDLIYNSLDKADPELDHVWADEAQRRLKAIENGRTELVSAEDVLGPRS